MELAWHDYINFASAYTLRKSAHCYRLLRAQAKFDLKFTVHGVLENATDSSPLISSVTGFPSTQQRDSVILTFRQPFPKPLWFRVNINLPARFPMGVTMSSRFVICLKLLIRQLTRYKNI